MQKKPHHKYQKLINQSALTLLVYVLRFILRFVKTAIISRLIGPTGRGVLSLIMLIPTLLVALGSLGFGQAVVFYVAKRGYNIQKVMGTTLVFLFFCSLLLLAAGWGVLHVPFITGAPDLQIDSYQHLILAAIPLLLMSRIGLQFLVAKGHVKAFNGIGIADSLIPLIIFAVLYALGRQPLLAAVLSWVLGLLIVSLMPYIWASKDGAYPPQFDRSFLYKGLRYGASSHLANVFQIALLRIDFLFVSYMLGPTELGYYAVATAIAELLIVLPESIAIPLIPLLFGASREESNQLTPLVAKATVLLLGAGSIVVAIVGKPVIGQIFGIPFLPSYIPLLWLLPGIIFLGGFLVLRVDMFSRKMPGMVSIFAASALVINLILTPIFIHISGGIEGAAISSSLSYLALLFLTFWFYSKQSSNNFVNTFFFSWNEIKSGYATLKNKLQQ